MSLIEVISALSEASHTERPQDRENPEFQAIMTHWLQTPESNPIYLDESVRELWITRIHELAPRLVSEGRIELPGCPPPGCRTNLFSKAFPEIPFSPPQRPDFRFIDLFAGIGGFRLAMQSLGGKCVFSCEWDKNAKKTYFTNFGEYPFGDVRQFTADHLTDAEIDRLIPDHEILCAGFPCQPFSNAGVSARNSLGRKSGFDCEIQGTLFFDIVRIAAAKKPAVLFLENVKGLKGNDKGRTFQIIRETIEGKLGYSFSHKLVNSNTMVPQNRERCYMVCFRDKEKFFDFPIMEGQPLKLRSILESDVPDSFTISDRLWEGHVKRTDRNIARGTGFTAFLANPDRPSNTLVARYGKDGKECLVPQAGRNPRMLTPRECARLQGFPENFIPAPARSVAYKQFGNAVTVPVVREIAREILKQMEGWS